MTTLKLPNSLKNIGYCAFRDCSKLTNVTVENPTPSSIKMGDNVFLNSSTNCILYVPKGSKSLYSSAQQWKGFSKIIDMSSNIEVSSITLSFSELTLKKGETYKLIATITPTNADDKILIWSSSNKSVVSVDNDGNVTAIGVGSATITAVANDNSGVSASCLVTVKKLNESFIPEYVDLGLPSGLLWATCNVGATKPEEYGSYYKWGETNEYDNSKEYQFDEWSESELMSESIINGNYALNPAFDAATANWGQPWRMPTDTEFEELIDLCSSTWTTYNGVEGRQFTGPNGKSIFLPAAGCYYYGKNNSNGSYGDYWSSTSDGSEESYTLYFGKGSVYCDSEDCSCYIGRSVRPVRYSNVLVSQITLSSTDISIKKGETQKLTAQVLPENATNKTIIWSSNKPSIATVDSDGNITAVGAGTAIITATANDGSGVSASCKVTVVDIIDVIDNTTLYTSTQIGAGKDIYIKQGGVLTVTGTQALAVKTLSMYLGESNPGALINNCSKLTAESVVARFAVSANTWHFITPMSDVNIDDVTHSNDGAFIFRQFDAAKRAQNDKVNCWADVTDGVLHAGQGYILRSNKTGEVIMPMPKAGSSDVFCTTDRSLVLNSHAANSLADEDWNYVGNPYPCYFNIQSMDCNAPITVRGGYKYTAYTVTDDNYTLSPMQAFFVQKTDNTNAIKFHKEGRVSTASKVRSKMPMDNGRKVFDILLHDGESADRTRVVINDNALLEYERECDAAKFDSEDADVAQIYSVGDHGTRFAINERPMLDGVVGLGLTLGRSGVYTISLGRGNDAVRLYDAETQQVVGLNVESYEFTASAGECRDRFYLYFDEATGIDAVHSSSSIVHRSNVYNLNGQAVGKDYKGIVRVC